MNSDAFIEIGKLDTYQRIETTNELQVSFFRTCTAAEREYLSEHLTSCSRNEITGFTIATLLIYASRYSNLTSFHIYEDNAEQKTLTFYPGTPPIQQKFISIDFNKVQTVSKLIQSIVPSIDSDNQFDYLMQMVHLNVPEIVKEISAIIVKFGPAPQDVELFFTINSVYKNTIQQQLFVGRFLAIFDQILNNSNKSIDQISAIGSGETEFINLVSSSCISYPGNTTIVQLLEENSIRHTDSISVAFNETSISYSALNARANQLANYLISKGVKKGDLVPICMPRCTEMIISIIAILKAGAAYVPIDPEYPAERIKFILNDTKATVVCSYKGAYANFNNVDCNVLDLCTDDPLISYQSCENLRQPISPQDLAYVIYTSGSTGNPKGVMIEHGALIDHCFGVIKSAHLGSCKSFALFSPLVFDAGHSIIHSAFVLAAKIHVLSENLLLSGDLLENYICHHQVDCIKIVPSLWLSYAEDGFLLVPQKVLIFGGEAFDIGILNRLSALQYKGYVFNHYGPTEATIGKSIFKVDINCSYTNVPIGRPFSNTTFYVLDDTLGYVGINVPGELYIAGEGLARGYLNSESLTQQRFIANPFSSDGARMYATGDLVKWLPDGNLEYIGRKDDQVKINGHRIEIGEIEAVMLRSGQVRVCAALPVALSNQSVNIIAFVLPNSWYDQDKLIDFIKNHLPAYMVPVRFVTLDKMPLTINGKTDKKALIRLLEDLRITKPYKVPQNRTQERLVDIWQQLFKIESISIDANFLELGGHSLLAMRLISSIKKEWKAQISLRDIFNCGDIIGLGELVDNNLQQFESNILAYEGSEKIPLTSAQKRLWFIDQVSGSLNYHLPSVWRIQGAVKVRAITKALWSIVDRHKILRTVIVEEDGEGNQNILSSETWSVEYKELPGVTGNLLRSNIQSFVDKPFDLSADFMMRAALLKVDAEVYLLVLNVHHIAFDGWSSNLLLKELENLYRFCAEKDNDLPVVNTLQYADYAFWQHNSDITNYNYESLVYWKNKMEDVAMLQLPFSIQPKTKIAGEGALVKINLGIEFNDKISNLNSRLQTTTFMVMLAAFKMLLYRHTGQKDICVGTPTAGRRHHQLDSVIGFFVNTLPLRTCVDEQEVFAGLVQKVKAVTLEAMDNQEVPFEKIVEATIKQRDANNSPLFQVMFVYQNKEERKRLQLDELGVTNVTTDYYDQRTAKFPLTIIVSEAEGCWDISFEYDIHMLNGSYVTNMAGHFKQLLQSALECPGEKIANLHMLASAETRLLLSDFNSPISAQHSSKTVIDLFEKRARETPHSTALYHDKRELTYSQLNDAANRLAHYLIGKGYQHTNIPVLLNKGVEMIVSIVAILKARAAYVPIDTTFPLLRIQHVINDCNTVCIITDEANQNKITKSGGTNQVIVDEFFAAPEMVQTQNPLQTPHSDDAAYIIYTSGSTGKPKGVVISHGGLYSSTTSRCRYYGFTGNAILIPSISFDSSVAVIFGTLAIGGTLLLCQDDSIKEPQSIQQLFLQTQTLLCIPSYYRFLLQEGLLENSKLQRVILAGEKLEFNLVNQHFQQFSEVELYNEYGPTEGTVWASVKKIEPTDNEVTIGKPIESVRVYIVDENLQLVPIGVKGEICLGGPQVAKGYLNSSKLSETKFITDFITRNTDHTIYRTGDTARWLENGEIEYIGRTDDQVKINGNRIEPAEIERVLLENPGIRQVVVVPQTNDNSQTRLVAYVVTTGSYTIAECMEYARKFFPAHMVPTAWMDVKEFPLTTNGKIDRKKLPDPQFEQINDYVQPVTTIQQTLAEVFSQLLQIDKVGIHDDFFMLGGHSLLAMRLVSIVKKKANLPLTLTDVFTSPNIAGLETILVNKRFNHDKSATTFNYLVPVKKGSGKAPLYIVAGGGDTALRFKAFAQLLADQQEVFVLQASLDGMSAVSFAEGIKQIAALYVNEILLQNPVGPYHISGYCIGGIIAHEIAIQLKAIGKKVASLILLDTIVPQTRQNGLEHATIVGANTRFRKVLLKLEYESFLLLNHTKQFFVYKYQSIKKIGALFQKMKKLKYDDIGLPKDPFTQSAQIYWQAQQRHAIDIYDGNLTVFYARERYYFNDVSKKIQFKKIVLNDDVKFAWKRYAKNVHVVDVDGEHSTLFDGEHGLNLAKDAQRVLDLS